MHNIAEGQAFGPITDKLIRDLLNAGVRLTAQVSDHPEQLAPRLHAYTVEITTALALAVNTLETAQSESLESAAPTPPRRPKRPGAGHLSVVKTEAD